MFYLDSVLNIIFLVDIFVNFNTAIITDDLEIIDDRKVRILKLNQF